MPVIPVPGTQSQADPWCLLAELSSSMFSDRPCLKKWGGERPKNEENTTPSFGLSFSPWSLFHLSTSLSPDLTGWFTGWESICYITSPKVGALQALEIWECNVHTIGMPSCASHLHCCGKPRLPVFFISTDNCTLSLNMDSIDASLILRALTCRLL